MNDISAPDRPSGLAEAAEAGDGAAAARLAVLTGMGLGVAPDWPRAMELLGRAATLGFEPARDQLALLAGTPAAGDGLDAGRRIDIAGWLNAPRPRVVSDGPAISGDIRHRGRKGDALMWANTLPDGSIDRRTRHAGLPPTRGEKWVLSQWLRGRAPKV